MAPRHIRMLGLRSLSSSLHSLQNKKVTIPFARSLDPVESSIHTMDKILTILRDAESTSHSEEVSGKAKVVSEDSELGYEDRFFSSLGNDVFEYRVILVLNKLQVVNHYSVFQQVSPETTKNIFRQYMDIFKERYTWKVNGNPESFGDLGRLFGQSPLSTMASLTAKINQLSSSLLVDGPEIRKKNQFKFDFPDVLFYQPFKVATEDPLVLRKGLSMHNHPLNLLATMVNDESVLKTFLERSRSQVSLLKLQNFMVAQSLEGSQAFKILVKRYLRHLDPETTIHSPFEGYHLANSDPDTESDIEIVKAIVASRSRLMDRLLPYRDYKFALLSMNESQQDTNEKVVKILADMFDRFFGVCYRIDAKYCDEWVEKLIVFYLQNEKNEALFEQLFKESILNFRQAYAGLQFDNFQFRWNKRNEKSPKKKSRYNGLSPSHSKGLVKDVRALLEASKLFHEKASP